MAKRTRNQNEFSSRGIWAIPYRLGQADDGRGPPHQEELVEVAWVSG